MSAVRVTSHDSVNSASRATTPRSTGARLSAGRTSPPLLPTRFVARPRLRDSLDAAVPLGVALLVAPGGFGKTVALADFVANASFPVAWLAVSPADADLVAFVEALTAAVRPILPRFGRRAARIARQVDSRAIPALADDLANDFAARGDPIGIVLDDFHHVDGVADVTRLVAALLEHAPPNCFVAVASRTLPPFPHARLIATGRMSGVAAEDLRFTPAEIATYLDVSPDESRVGELHSATGGWPAALLLGGGTRSEGFPSAIDEYLEQEVFGQQPPDVQDFLLYAAVPPLLDADTCTRLLDAPRGVEHLARAHRLGLFVAALPGNVWRLHDLFRDFLRGRLRRTEPELWSELNRRVSDDLRERGFLVDAITQLVEAGLHDEAARLILDEIDTLTSEGRWSAIRRWLGEMSPRIVHAHPRLLTLHGRALTPTGDPATALALLDRAVDACVASGDSTGAAEALSFRAVRQSSSGRFEEAKEDCRQSRELLAGRDHRVLATVARLEGLIAARDNDIPRAFASLNEALQRSQRHRDRHESAMCERALGWLYSLAGDVGTASAHYERVARAFADLGDLSALGEVKISLGHTYRLMGATPDAQRCFQDAREIAERAEQRRVYAFALSNLGVLDREAGDYIPAIGRFNEVLEIARQIDDVELLGYTLDDLAQCHRVAGSGPRTSEVLARQAVTETERARLAPAAARARATLGAALFAQDRVTEALEIARSAVRVLSAGAPRSDLIRAYLVAALAGQVTGADSWLEDLRLAKRGLELLPARGFMRAEIAALGGKLRSLLSDPEAAPIVAEILSLAARESAISPQPMCPTVPAAPPKPAIHARLLGRPEVLVDGRVPRDVGGSWQRRATRELFFLLESHRQGVSAERIIDLLWPDAALGQGQQVLWTSVNRLRSALGGPNPGRGRDHRVLSLVGGVYRLDADLPLTTDVAAFEAAAGRAFAAKPDSIEEGESLAAAAAAYGGEYLDGLDCRWIFPRRQALAHTYARVLRRLAERATAANDVPEAAEHADRWLAVEPLSEAACEIRLRALLALDDRDRARLVFRAFAKRMRRLLGTDPSPHLAQLVDMPTHV